jgi:hypothetical protein
VRSVSSLVNPSLQAVRSVSSLVNPSLQGSEVRVLTKRGWKPDYTWTLRPGDMLYVPPQCPHCGIATSSGQTLSVGFLAPSHEELISSFAADAIARAAGKRFYEDQPSVQLSLFAMLLLFIAMLPEAGVVCNCSAVIWDLSWCAVWNCFRMRIWRCTDYLHLHLHLGVLSGTAFCLSWGCYCKLFVESLVL